MAPHTTPDSPTPDLEIEVAYDPVFLHARREALFILALFGFLLVWSVTICYGFGYATNTQNITTVLGMPKWVFWGVLIPWILADVATIWFCFFYMVDDDLGQSEEELAEEELAAQELAEGKTTAGEEIPDA